MDIGGTSGAATDSSGLIWVWGQNTKGELGVGDYSSRVHPYPLVSLKGKSVDALAIGGNYAMALGRPYKQPFSQHRDSFLTDSQAMPQPDVI